MESQLCSRNLVEFGVTAFITYTRAIKRVYIQSLLHSTKDIHALVAVTGNIK